MLGTCSSSKHTENSSTGADIKNNFVFKVNGVVLDGFLVSKSSHLILKHLLVNIEVRITSKIVVLLVSLGKFSAHLLLEQGIYRIIIT